MKKTFAFLGALALISPIAATAATYNYVDTMGMVRSIEANSPSQAMTLATDMHPRSGVSLDQGMIQPGTTIGGSGDISSGASGTAEFHYVDTSGTVRTVFAASAMDVMRMSDIHPHSGVALDQGILNEGMTVPGT